VPTPPSIRVAPPTRTGEPPLIRVETYEGLSAVAALRPAWAALFTRCPDATPFQAPSTLLPWAGRYAGERLAAAAAWEGGRLVGLAAAFSWEGRLLLAGTGPTDYQDALVLPGRADVAEVLLAALAELARARDCPAMELHQLRPGSPLLAAAAPTGWTGVVEAGDPCPVAPTSAAEPLAAMPDKWRKKLAYTRRKIERAGGFTVEDAAPATVASMTAALADLHGRRWRASGEAGVLADPLMAGFVADAAPQWLAEGLLRLRALRIGGEVAAVLLALHAHATTCMYLVGVDPARMELGPGTLLIARTIQQAAAEGATAIDFLRGEEPYKANWGAVPRPTWRRRMLAI